MKLKWLNSSASGLMSSHFRAFSKYRWVGQAGLFPDHAFFHKIYLPSSHAFKTFDASSR